VGAARTAAHRFCYSTIWLLSIGLIDIGDPVDALNPAAVTGLMRYCER
jgi:hypothetical protein